ncbi:hypothetical protein BGX20_008980 [Mortierella sp. AD010]|nr:hypothetical protein BGX20_008980 [Mortierella sp. AD010]
MTVLPGTDITARLGSNSEEDSTPRGAVDLASNLSRIDLLLNPQSRVNVIHLYTPILRAPYNIMANAKQEEHSLIRQSNDLFGMTPLPRTEITMRLESNSEEDSTPRNETDLANSRSSNLAHRRTGLGSSTTNRCDYLEPDTESEINTTALQTTTTNAIDEVDEDQTVPQSEECPGNALHYSTDSIAGAWESNPDLKMNNDNRNNQTRHSTEGFVSSIPIGGHNAVEDHEQKAMEDNYNQGVAYNFGGGVAVDYPKAFECLLKAAKQGHVDAHNKLGYMCYHGHGVGEDHARAMEWYLIAANNGYAKSQYNIGMIYQPAKAWFGMASRQWSGIRKPQNEDTPMLQIV